MKMSDEGEEIAGDNYEDNDEYDVNEDGNEHDEVKMRKMKIEVKQGEGLTLNTIGCKFVGMCVCIRSSLHSVRFGQLLRCAQKRIVNIMKVYSKMNNIQVELIGFRKKL